MKGLPEELLNQVVSYFAVAGPEYDQVDLKTLTRLSRVSKQFHRIVQPHLYAHLRGGPRGRSARLLQTIQRKPWLGLHAKSLIANGTALTDHLHPQLRLRDLLLEDPDRASSKRRRKYYKANFGEIISHLPNLEYLDVSKPKGKLQFGELPPWLNAIENYMLDPLHGRPPFENLKRLDADVHDIRLIELHNVFNLPQLQILTLHNGTMDYSLEMTSRTRRQIISAWRFHNCTLRHLRFVGLQPARGIWAMQLVAGSVPCLEGLSFIGGPDRGFGANFHRAMMGIFLPVITNPDFLRLEMWDMAATAPNQWCSYRALRSWGKVGNYSPVKTLIVDANIVVGMLDYAHLPLRLEELWLRSNAGPTTGLTHQQLGDYIMRFQRPRVFVLYPTLKRCRFILQETDEFTRALLEEHREAIERVGIDVNVMLLEKEKDGAAGFREIWGMMRSALRWVRNGLGR